MHFSLNSTVILIDTSIIIRNFIIPPPPILAHRECIRELGEPAMKKAYQLLDKVEPEQAEVYHRESINQSSRYCTHSITHTYTLSLMHAGGSFWTTWPRCCLFLHREAAAAEALRGLSL